MVKPEYRDVLYEEQDGVATVTLNRPDSLNAIRVGMYEELTDAIHRAGWNRAIGVIVLTGAGTRAFCVGGDTSDTKSERSSQGITGVPLDRLHAAIRDVPKPVIAKVRGYAIGGGNVLATLCDLTIAAQSAVFGQVEPRVGSVDTGFGTAYLSRVVGEKRAREMWFLCRRYSAEQAERMGLVNVVVADESLDAEVARWCSEILTMSPTAIAIAKASFNADSDGIKGISAMGLHAVALYYPTDEAKEAGKSFREKRKPVFRTTPATR
ncbi:enoyl-CoA hydratase-related protein [Bordetella sp. BOR01]|uniref:enoyl-CoA hydratase-related protein n=1 Tax=Bordetella sp. BOR01 TaxID=2854779 RepID=UPI001C48D2D0|nr:enoyl-CoA hydratase-related protein [Bordetella sp. BOR01]MBV7483189.1 enoyl-CoA hydratase/isomerase family protein [Bordetella sp. BOR01]